MTTKFFKLKMFGKYHVEGRYYKMFKKMNRGEIKGFGKGSDWILYLFFILCIGWDSNGKFNTFDNPEEYRKQLEKAVEEFRATSIKEMYVDYVENKYYLMAKQNNGDIVTYGVFDDKEEAERVCESCNESLKTWEIA